MVALGSSYKHFLGLPSVRVFCILCCVRLLSLYYLNSAKSDITIDQFLRSILLRFFIIVFRLVRDVVANHKTTRYAGAATKVIQKNHLA